MQCVHFWEKKPEKNQSKKNPLFIDIHIEEVYRSYNKSNFSVGTIMINVLLLIIIMFSVQWVTSADTL